MVSLGRLMDWTALVHLGNPQWWTHKATMKEPQCVSSSRGRSANVGMDGYPQEWYPQGWIFSGSLKIDFPSYGSGSDFFSAWKPLSDRWWKICRMEPVVDIIHLLTPNAPLDLFCIPWPLLDGLHPAQEVTFYHEESPSKYFSANWDGVQQDK